MRPTFFALILLSLFACGTGVSPVNVSATQPHGQDARATQDAHATQDARATAVIKLRVRVGTPIKGLSRKRFFLISGSSTDNKDLLQSFKANPVTSRDCYYRKKLNASDALIAWLEKADCESVFCREVDSNDAVAVPEFAKALAVGEKEYGNSELARKWLAVNVTEPLRSGFYKLRQQELQTSLKLAEDQSKTKVMSLMTDRNGTAFFTDVLPGNYVISNVLRTELRNSSQLWFCDVKVDPPDLAMELPFLIVDPANSNPSDKKIKCVSLEEPLPACPRNP